MLNDSSWHLFEDVPPLWAAPEPEPDEPPPPDDPSPFDEPSDDDAQRPSTVYARIKYLLSEDGRRDSLRKGGNGRREQETGGYITHEDLSSFKVAIDGKVTFDATGGFGPLDFALPPHARWVMTSPHNGDLHFDKVPTWDNLLEVVRGYARALADVEEAQRYEAEETQRIIDAFLNDPKARATRIDSDWTTFGGKSFPKGDKVSIEARRRLEQDQEDLRKANRATLAKWIQQHGTDNQRQRLKVGLLPWAEALSTLEEHVYAPLADMPLYERFDPHQVCVCPSREFELERICKVTFRSVDATELDADEWDQFSRIKAAVPNATLQLREHSAECESDDPKFRRGVIVKFTIDALTVKRQYALTKGEFTKEVPF